MKAPKFKEFITEKVQRSDIQVAILTKIDADSKAVVSNMILKECKKRNIPCHIINTSEAWVSKNDLEKDHNARHAMSLNAFSSFQMASDSRIVEIINESI